jgi:hypothetical protein
MGSSAEFGMESMQSVKDLKASLKRRFLKVGGYIANG